MTQHGAATAGPAGAGRWAPAADRWRTAVRVVALVGIVGSLVWIRALAFRRTDTDVFFVYASLAPVAYLLPGLVLLWRRSWHVVGWLLCGLAVVVGFAFSSEVGVAALRAHDPWLVWVLDVFEGPLLWCALTSLLVVFPDGLAAQSRWHRRIGTATLLTTVLATAPDLFVTRVGVSDAGTATLPSPLPVAFVPRAVVDEVSLLVVWGGLLVAFVGLVLRHRAAHAALRRQYRWVLWALGALGPALVIGLVGAQVTGAAWLPMLAAYVAVPIAFMVAILRYRLYEIDRLVSRTVAYAVVVVLLAGTYAAVTAVLALVLPADSDLAVAASTLVVAGGFRPMQRRVRRAVVREQLRAVVGDTLSPTTVDVWIRG